MATEPEIHRFRNNPDEAQRLSKFLLDAYEALLTDWEIDFLKDVSSKKFEYGLSYRQAEKLLQIRDDCHSITHHRGLSIESLLQRCWEGRSDLGEANEEFIERCREKSTTRVRSRDLPRLLSCAHRLGWIESHMLIKSVEIDFDKSLERATSEPPAIKKIPRLHSSPGVMSR